jgi:hypothetical protein
MPLPKLRLTYVFTDESEQVIETRLFRCTADEIAFERRFGFPMSARLMAGAREMQEAERGATNGDLPAARMDALASMTFEQRSEMMRSEDTAFFAWCVWNRNAAGAGNPTEEFDAWLTTLAALDVDSLEPKVAEGLDPTATAPLG